MKVVRGMRIPTCVVVIVPKVVHKMKSKLDPKLIKGAFQKHELTEFNKVVQNYFDSPIEIIDYDSIS